jgi:hypothetical protein
MKPMIALSMCVVALGAYSAEQDQGRHERMMSKQLSESEASLHELMQPIWHSPKAEGATRACARTDAIQARVDAAVAAKGTGANLAMSKTANRLGEACKDKRMQDVPGLLDELHQQFHKMIGAE